MTASTNSPAALDVACPICGVEAGEPCQNVVRGFIRSERQPHRYLVQVAREMVKAMTTARAFEDVIAVWDESVRCEKITRAGGFAID